MDNIDNRAVTAADFVELRFKPGTWEAKGIPEQGCWIQTSTLDRIIVGGGQLEIEDLVADLLKWFRVTNDRGATMCTLSLIAHRHGLSLRR